MPTEPKHIRDPEHPQFTYCGRHIILVDKWASDTAAIGAECEACLDAKHERKNKKCGTGHWRRS